MTMEEDEEVLVALIEHRSKRVTNLQNKIASYNSELDKALKALNDSQRKLACLRRKPTTLPSSSSTTCTSTITTKQQQQLVLVKQEEDLSFYHNNNVDVDVDVDDNDDCTFVKTKRKPILFIPGHPIQPPPIQKPPHKKRKFVPVDLKDVCENSPPKVKYESSTLIRSNHKRKPRTLVLSPTDDRLFATSALDGNINMWQIHSKSKSHANLVASTNVLSLKQKRWPEDVAWHPNGDSIVSVYAADDGESQLSFLNLNKGEEKNEVVFLEDKPHDKGIINNIMFMPWGDNSFVTCGCDHAVVHWKEKHKKKSSSWKPTMLHRSIHSSAVTGVAGMQHQQMVVSVGADKRIIRFDLQSQKADFNIQIENKCMGIVPNPCDFNLFMVQTGTPQRQLRLFDMRIKGTQIHEFGWNQESSPTQSALINQSWSPDGFYLTSGSADPVIHIFDIRFNSNQPSLSIKAHKKRVFKAAWHKSYPLLISISSDLDIGLHNIHM